MINYTLNNQSVTSSIKIETPYIRDVKLNEQGYLTVHRYLQKLVADQNLVRRRDPANVGLSLPLKTK